MANAGAVTAERLKDQVNTSVSAFGRVRRKFRMHATGDATAWADLRRVYKNEFDKKPWLKIALNDDNTAKSTKRVDAGEAMSHAQMTKILASVAAAAAQP